MTPPTRDRTFLVASLAAAIGLILGLCLGAVFGGIGAYLIGQRWSVQRLPSLPTPPVQFRPELPAIPTPELREPLAPFGGQLSGALVREVLPGSPAERADIRVGDIILEVDGESIGEGRSLSSLIARHRPGEQVMLTVWREMQTVQRRVVLDTHPDDPGKAYLGIRYLDLAPNPPPEQD